jgi:hypothetical protein
VRLTRRQLLRASPGALLAAGLWPGALSGRDAEAPALSFAVLNDLHCVDRACGAWLAGVVKRIKALPEKVELCLVAGDLAEHGRPAQLTAARDALRGLGLPVRVVIGNHDYQKGDDRRAYEEVFPGSLNYTFEQRGWQFVGLDSSHGLRWRDVSVQPATLKWLEGARAKLDRRRPLVVFTHFPLGAGVPNRVSNADAVLGLLKGHNLRAVFGGHYHGLTERAVGPVVLTTNRCCSLRARNHDGSREKGFFVVTARDGRLARRFVEVKVGA